MLRIKPGTAAVRQFAVLLTLVGAVEAAFAQDTDDDGIQDATEAALLTALSPAWFPHDANEATRGPQSITWLIRNGYMIEVVSGTQVAFFPGFRACGATPDQALSWALARQAATPAAEIQFGYCNRDGGRDSQIPGDPMGWAYLNTAGGGMYGRVWRPLLSAPERPLAENEYLVQYFLYFGYNDTDAPPPPCDLVGDHEGDWITVEFRVDGTSPSRPRIVNAVYHNHGRQVFVRSPAGLRFVEGRPSVYIEREANEPWPFPGNDGFRPDAVPALIDTNERLSAAPFGITCTGEYESPCNFGYTAVRQHLGLAGPFFLSAVNVGSVSNPYPGHEPAFFLQYPGRYGSFWVNGCGIDTASPKGPRFQSEMWDRTYPRISVWSNYLDLPVVHASPNAATQSGSGASAASPVRGLSGALPLVASGGTIVLQPGTYVETPMTIRDPMVITASGGPATIAP